MKGFTARGLCSNKIRNNPYDSISESAATAETTLEITETITAIIMINNPPPKTMNITERLLNRMNTAYSQMKNDLNRLEVSFQ